MYTFESQSKVIVFCSQLSSEVIDVISQLFHILHFNCVFSTKWTFHLGILFLGAKLLILPYIYYSYIPLYIYPRKTPSFTTSVNPLLVSTKWSLRKLILLQVFNAFSLYSLQGALLQRELKDDDNEIKVLEDKLMVEQKKYEESFTKRQKEVDTMEVSKRFMITTLVRVAMMMMLLLVVVTPMMMTLMLMPVTIVVLITMKEMMMIMLMTSVIVI